LVNRVFRSIVLLLCAAVGSLLHAAEVSVAVAANFTSAAKKIALNFEKDTGHTARLAFGSTGRFHAQIANGAPFDVLLAADDETPLRLEKQGFAVSGSRFTYAVGRLVLWSRQPGFVDAQGAVLQSGRFERIAIADPKLAPYGAAAIESMTRLGVLNRLQPKFVQGENIAQTYQFVASENAQLGFVALGQVFDGGRLVQGSAWVVPQTLHKLILQDAVLLKRGSANPAAIAFMSYLQGKKAQDIIRAGGYEVCGGQSLCQAKP
jgi:molybdate transport system substrate-binding protein